MYKLLYLAPQPRDASAIDNRQDAQSIAHRLNQLGLGSSLKVLEKINPLFADLPFWLLEDAPQLVHFVGHGTQLSKLLFVDNTGSRHDIPPEAVAKLFTGQAAKKRMRGVVLNTCYSVPVAQSFVESVDFVVCNAGEIQNESAVHFAEIFYPFLVRGETLQLAFDQGVAQVLANRKGTQGEPTLLVRKGIDPKEYRLSEPQPKPPLVFVHHDAECAEDRRLADELFTMLQAHRIPFWDVTQILPGGRRADEVTSTLERMTHFLPLLSSDAQAKDKWLGILQQGMARAQSGEASIFPVFLRPTLRSRDLEDFEHFPPGKKAVSQYKQRDGIWVKLVEMLRKSIDGKRGAG